MITKDPDDLYGDEVLTFITIEVYGDGSLKVFGDIHFKQYALDVIDAAKKSIIGQTNRPELILPRPPIKPNEITDQIQIKCRRNGNMSTGGSITDKVRALKVLENAREAITQYHNEIERGKTISIPGKDTDLG
jgi:hypothetical protein